MRWVVSYLPGSFTVLSLINKHLPNLRINASKGCHSHHGNETFTKNCRGTYIDDTSPLWLFSLVYSVATAWARDFESFKLENNF